VSGLRRNFRHPISRNSTGVIETMQPLLGPQTRIVTRSVEAKSLVFA
jgi:hypothetical protein